MRKAKVFPAALPSPFPSRVCSPGVSEARACTLVSVCTRCRAWCTRAWHSRSFSAKTSRSLQEGRGVVEWKGPRVQVSAAYLGDSKRLYLSVSARRRPSCTISDGGPCSAGGWLCGAWLSCGFSWDSALLHSSDLGETAFFSASTNSSRLSSRCVWRQFWTPRRSGRREGR